MVKKWTREYNPNVFEVEIHSNMYTEAAKVLRKLPEVLEREYGKTAADALTYTHQEAETIISQEILVITLETEDRYMNGSAQFIFTGLETVGQSMKNPTQLQEDERSMNVRSTTSGLTGHRTVGSQDPSMEPTNMDVDSTMGSTPAVAQHRDPPDKGWTQVGTDEDKDRLQRLMEKEGISNPGGNQGRRHP